MSDAPECLPPEGTDDFTMHWLSREIGDGSCRENFQALWTGGMWDTKGICLSPLARLHGQPGDTREL